jgi:hypothetical protein
VGGDVLEIGEAVAIAGDTIAVVLDREVVRAVLAAAGDGDGLRAGIDAVLDELGDRLERIALRQRDDPNRVPVIADPQLAAIVFLDFMSG